MSLRIKKYLKSICFGIFAFSLFLLAAPERVQAGDTCFCHFEGSGDFHTICTSGGAAATHRDIHGDQPFGCECGDGFCSSAIGEDCFTCPQDCPQDIANPSCDTCGDGTIQSPEECDGSSAACAGVTGCSADGSDCMCDGCRCAPTCVVDGLCGGSEDCNNCSADCGACAVCGNGVVEAGEACDDGNAVNGDCCNNSCAVTTNSCSDGNACNGDEVCSAGSCGAGTPLVCSDANVCNGTETCDPSTGCQLGTSLNCDDSDECSDDTCDSTLGCQHSAIVCTDGDFCTTDTCDVASGCLFPTLSCNDADACTQDSCDSGLGCAYAPTNCDDNVDCTIDDCDSAAGCIHSPDHSACDDGNPCTDDSCDSATGCGHSNNTLTCDDGDACTPNDVCGGGACAGSDGDVDTVGDTCDTCPGGNDTIDSDKDGIPNVCDTCAGATTDSDGDGTPDACDACPSDNPNDVDGDGICTSLDNCPSISNPDQADTNENGAGDACDDEGVLSSNCIALPGNQPPVVTMSGPKLVSDGVFEIAFSVSDPDGDSVTTKVASTSGEAVINGGVITFTLPRPLNLASPSVDVTMTASDSASCQASKQTATVFLSAGGDQAGGCMLVR